MASSRSGTTCRLLAGYRRRSGFCTGDTGRHETRPSRSADEPIPHARSVSGSFGRSRSIEGSRPANSDPFKWLASHARCRRQGSKVRNAAGCGAFGGRGWCLQTTPQGVSTGRGSARHSRVCNLFPVVERVGRLCRFGVWNAGSVVQSLRPTPDRKSTRLNSSHSSISYAVFCLKKKKKIILFFYTQKKKKKKKKFLNR